MLIHSNQFYLYFEIKVRSHLDFLIKNAKQFYIYFELIVQLHLDLDLQINIDNQFYLDFDFSNISAVECPL